MGPTPSAQLATVRDGSSALGLVDSLPEVSLAQVSGLWRGTEVPTGHPMDGLLERYGWWGKDLRDPEAAHPLLFAGADGQVRPLDPRRIPTTAAFRGWAPRARWAARLTGMAHPLLATRTPAAQLRMFEHRGTVTAAMVYDSLPVIDVFRRLGPPGPGGRADTLLGVMDRWGQRQPFVFVLRRHEGPDPLDGFAVRR